MTWVRLKEGLGKSFQNFNLELTQLRMKKCTVASFSVLKLPVYCKIKGVFIHDLGGCDQTETAERHWYRV